MAEIHVDTDCGNSPKREFIKAFNIAFARQDFKFILESITDDVTLNIIGDKKIEGNEAFKKELELMQQEISSLHLHQILSHGKEGAANGIIKMKNGKKYAFADFYIFSSAKGAKIKALTSYIIEIAY